MNTVYTLGENLYFNITNQCTNRCVFCIRNFTDNVGGKILWLEREPTSKEILEELKNYYPLNKYKEIVFCGFGEPLLRLNIVKKIIEYIKIEFPSSYIRIDTNGHGNIFHQRNILPELKDLVDAISISLNAENSEKYNKICRPIFKDAYKQVLEFIKLASKYIKDVQVTVVDIPDINKEICREIAEVNFAKFYVREFLRSL
jgi:TatD family-associated radical SAM protein